MTLQQYEHTGAAPATGLAAPIGSTDLSLTLNSGTGYPTGAGSLLFVLVVDPGQAVEEKILCSARSGASVTVQTGGRGYDGTTAASHAAGATNVQHVWTAAEASDASAHIYVTSRDDHTQYLRTDSSRAGTGTTQTFLGLAVTNDAAVGGDLTVTADASIGGDETITGTLGVTGDTQLSTATLSGLLTASGHVTTPEYTVTGLANTDTIHPGRWVGTGTPPIAGTWALNDFVIGQGAISICTVAGTPGTWVTIGTRGTLAEVSTTTPSSSTGTNIDWQTVPSFTVDGTRRVKVMFNAYLNGTAGNLVQLRLMEGATVLQVAQEYIAVSGGPGQVSCLGFWEGVPGAGAHVYKTNVCLLSGSGSSAQGEASATAPAFVLVEDIG